MWALLIGLLTAVKNRWQIVLYSSIGLAIIASMILLRQSGKKSAELEQLRDWSRYQQERASDRAKITRMRNRDVREQLRRRWASK